MKGDIDNNKILRNAIEQWPVRVKRAGKNNYELASAAGISDTHFSQIINFKIKKPRLTTLNAVEDALTSWGV